MSFLFEKILFVWIYNSGEYVWCLFFSSISCLSIVRPMYKIFCTFHCSTFHYTYFFIIYRGRYGIAGSPCRLLRGGKLVRIY